MIPNGYARKLATDEIRETLFFATGQRPIKNVNEEDVVELSCAKFFVEIISHKVIFVNNDRCSSAPEAKYVIQMMIDD